MDFTGMLAHEPSIIIIILVIAMVLFIWGYWRYDIVALLALMVSTIVGAVPFNKVYSGLSNPAVITVACVMVISDVIITSGVLNKLITQITKIAKTKLLHVGSLTLVTAVLSAFMNNIGALGIMMPITIETARKNNRSPSLLLMPIALGSALGGLTTLIGTPPNLLISSYRERVLGQPFAMFDFSYVGVITAIAGILFVTFIGWRLLPTKRKGKKRSEDLFQVQDYITEIEVLEKAKIAGKTVVEFEKLIKGDFLIIGLIRKKRKKLIIPPDYVLKAGDILILEISAEDLKELLEVDKLELVHDIKISSELLKSDDISLVEAVIPPASALEGRSSKSLRLRSRYHMNLLAISRQGLPFKKRLHQESFRAGDVVLLQGNSESIQENMATLGFLPLTERSVRITKPKMAFLPLLIFICAIILAAFQLIPVEIAFGGAVLVMALLRLVSVRTLYDSIDWSVIILLAAMIPIGNALLTTGGTTLISHYILILARYISPFFILSLVMIVTMTLSDFMNNAATTVVMAPIAVSIAQSLQLNIDPFLMAVAIGASCSFLTPVGHQNNTLVMGPGGYKFSDYIRMGLPLEILIIIVSLPLIDWIWPLY